MAFRGCALGPGSAGAESLTDVDIFFHPWVKMSSISFYSSFVTSLLSPRFCRLPLLVSQKRAAVAEPVIISALCSGPGGSRGLGPHCGAQQVAEAGRVTPRTLLCRGPSSPQLGSVDVKGQGRARLPYLCFCVGLGGNASRSNFLGSSLGTPFSLLLGTAVPHG